MNKMKIRSVVASLLVCTLVILQLSSTMFPVNVMADEVTNEVTDSVDTTQESAEEDDKVITNDENCIPDANLYAVLLNAGDSNHDGILTVGEAKKITSLSCELAKIETFKNLAKYALNIQSLSDSTNIYTASASDWNEEKVSSFCEEYSKLENVKSTKIVSNDVTLLNCICSKQSLTNLYIYSPSNNNSQKLNIEGLKKLSPNLTSFTMYGINAVKSLKDDTNLLDCTNLSYITLSCPTLSDVDGISALTNLSWLVLDYCYQLKELGDCCDIT